MDYTSAKNRLTGEYAEAFEKAELYAMCCDMYGSKLNEIMMDLADMLLTAQDKGMPAKKVVGDDMEDFCRSFFSVYSTKDKIAGFLTSVYRTAWLVFIVESVSVLFSIGEKGFNFWTHRSDITPYMVGVLAGMFITCIVDAVFKKMMFRLQKMRTGIYTAVIFAVIFGAAFIAPMVSGGKIFNVPTAPVLIGAGAYVLIYIVVRAIIRYKNTGSITKKGDPYRISMKKDIDANVVFEHEKMFHKRNAKLEKKGKPLHTAQEFTAQIKKNNKISRVSTIAAICICVVCSLFAVVTESVTNSIGSALMFGAVLLVIEALLLLMFLGPGVFAERVQRRMIETCDRENLTIIELAERLRALPQDAEDEEA